MPGLRKPKQDNVKTSREGHPSEAVNWASLIKLKRFGVGWEVMEGGCPLSPTLSFFTRFATHRTVCGPRG